MSGRLIPWAAAGGALLAFVLLAWLAASLMTLSALELGILWGVMLLLGAVAGFLVYRMVAARVDRTPSEPDEIAEALDEARRRLLESRVEGKRGLPNLPAVVVLGPGGSAKTTSVVQSGLDLELLTGDVFRGDTVAPTSGVNVWYAGGTMLVEAGGALLQDEDRWKGLAQRLRPARLQAAVAGRPQAPRTAIVCLSCEELIRPGAAEAVPAAARRLRTRLQELSGRLGVRLPVYVLFTKADRLPYFDDYVRNLSDGEARQVLGVTLPIPPARPGGAYADRMADAISRTFSALTGSLARKRLEQLSRESREEVKAGIYEFPRELAKLPPLVGEFLVELCRPSQLAVSPFLRGYYFTGVRARVRTDPGGAPDPRAAAPSGAPAGATMVFDAARRASAPSPAPSRGRKVPQWVFLEPFFRRLVLRDETARAVTAGGHGVNLMRRGLLGAAVAAGLILTIGLTVSFAGNRALVRDAATAIEETEDLTPLQAGLPTLSEVQELEQLRTRLDRVLGYERDGAPWRLRWGLYTGSVLRPPLQRVYYDRFDRMLGGEARAALTGYLSRLPATPGETSDYDGPYNALRAYLLITDESARSRGDLLGPTLQEHWLRGRSPDPELAGLAADQFAFYGDELAYGNPYALRKEDRLVSDVREYLAGFQGQDRLYRSLITEASGSAPAIRFNDARPGSGDVLRAGHTVPGAFTSAGWQAVNASLDDVESLFGRDEWVTGIASVGQADIGRIEESLRTRYVREYIDHWRRFLEEAEVSTFRGTSDATAKLEALAGNQSLLLQLLQITALETNVDSVTVAPAFQPVHLVTPPTVTDRYISEANKPYMDALNQLHAAMEAVATASGPMRDGALSEAGSAVSQGKGAARQIAQGFRVDGPSGAVGTRVRQLLEAPLERAETLVGYLPAAEVNQHGRRFCGQWTPISRSYPFSPSSARQASLRELDAALKPGESALSSLHQDALRDLVVPQGSGFAARVGTSPTPTRQFLAFYNRLHAVSRGFYGSDGSGPAFDFALRLEPTARVPEIVVDVDGQTHRFTRSRPAQRTFRWEGSRAQNASIRGLVDGREVTLVSAESGTWALFRLLQKARWEQLGSTRYRLSWPIPGSQVTLEGEVLMTGDAPILDTRYLDRLDCISTIATR